MKRKPTRNIPDFGSKGPKSAPLAKQALLKQQPAPVSPQKTVNVKPMSTSSKSGQRGT